MAISEVLALLKRYRIRQADLAQRLDVSKTFLSDCFSGKKPMPAYLRHDLVALAALARDATAAGGEGRDALDRWLPITLLYRRQSGGEAFTSTWDVSAPPDQWTLPQTGEDSGRFWFALGLEGLRSYATGDWTTLSLDGTDCQEVRHRLVMAWHGVCAMQEIWAKMPLPGQEQGAEVTTSRETQNEAKRGTK